MDIWVQTKLLTYFRSSGWRGHQPGVVPMVGVPADQNMLRQFGLHHIDFRMPNITSK